MKMKVIIFYWLKDKEADFDRLKEALEKMQLVDKVEECVVGTPLVFEDDLMDMSYDLALELTMACKEDFPEVFHSPEHMAVGGLLHEMDVQVKGYNILF